MRVALAVGFWVGCVVAALVVMAAATHYGWAWTIQAGPVDHCEYFGNCV